MSWKDIIFNDKDLKEKYEAQRTKYQKESDERHRRGDNAKTAAATYLEEKQDELEELEKMYNEYQEKGREILESIWNNHTFDANSVEMRSLETLLAKEYKEYGIDPNY